MQKLREIMRPNFLTTVPLSATVADAVRAMVSRNVGIVAVLDGDTLVGVFSERDVVRRVVNCDLDPNTMPVKEVMTVDLVVGDADDDYHTAMQKMDLANIRHLPVVSDDRLLAMLSIRDLMRVHVDHL